MINNCSIRTRSKWGILISLVLSCLFVTTSAAALTDDIINEQQKTYNAELGKYNLTEDKIKRLHSAIRAAKAKLDDKANKKKDSAATLEDIQHIDRKNPSLGLDNKVQEARQHNRHAYEEHRKAENELAELQEDLVALEVKLNDSIIILNSLAREIKRRSEQVVSKKLEERLATFKTMRTVEGHGEVGCGEESLRKCQNRARLSAERDATEKGSIVIVQAATQIDNFQLTKDQVKTNVQARLSNVEILKKGWVSDSSYQYHIRAQVTPVVGNLLTTQIKDSIIREMGIVVPAIISAGASVAPIAISSGSSTFSSNTSAPYRQLAQKTAAEKSFDEMDRDTGHQKTEVERDLEKQQPRKEKAVIHIHKEEKPRFRTEGWYALIGLGSAERIDVDGEDIYASLNDNKTDRTTLTMDFGLYLPVGRSMLMGAIYSGVSDKITLLNDAVGTTTLERTAFSIIAFSGKGIGHGWFYRTDVGSTVGTVKFENTLSSDFQQTSEKGLGVLIGLGYSWALSNESRILFSVNYSVDSIENSDYTATSFNVAGLW